MLLMLNSAYSDRNHCNYLPSIDCSNFRLLPHFSLLIPFSCSSLPESTIDSVGLSRNAVHHVNISFPPTGIVDKNSNKSWLCENWSQEWVSRRRVCTVQMVVVIDAKRKTEVGGGQQQPQQLEQRSQDERWKQGASGSGKESSTWMWYGRRL